MQNGFACLGSSSVRHAGMEQGSWRRKVATYNCQKVTPERPMQQMLTLLAATLVGLQGSGIPAMRMQSDTEAYAIQHLIGHSVINFAWKPTAVSSNNCGVSIGCQRKIIAPFVNYQHCLATFSFDW
jgi:hypothetical protein